MFHGECSEVGVGNEVGGSAAFVQQSPENFPIVVGRLNQAHARLVQPTLRAGGGLAERQGTAEDARIGADAEKGREHRLAKRDRFGAAQLGIPPRADGLVMFREAVLRVERDIRIEENHRCSSPSPTANNPAMSS